MRIRIFSETSKNQLAVLGIVVIGTLEYFAIQAGINGVGLSASIGAIGYLAGRYGQTRTDTQQPTKKIEDPEV